VTLAAMLRSSFRNSHENPAVPLTSTTLIELFGGTKGKSGKAVTETSALAMSAVYRATNIISGTCAGLPFHVFEQDGDARIRLEEGPAAELLDDPHPDMTPFELWELVYGSLCLWGNAYLLKLRNPLGVVVELWWVNPSRVKAFRDDEDGRKRYVIDHGKTTQQVHDDATMLHIPGFGYDGICGVSVIRLAREGIGLALAAEEYGARLFGNGSLATGILQTEQRLDSTGAAEIKKVWKETGGQGLESAHDIRVVGSGAKWTQLSIPPEDAQFLESRKFQVTEVARWFGLPPHMLADTEKSTSWGSGIEAQQIAMVVYTFASWLTRVEQRVTKHVVRLRVLPERRSAPKQYARYSTAGLLRGDSASRAAFYQTLWGLGALSTNDIRRLEELPPVPGGDVRYRPLNFGVLGEADPGDPAPEPAGDGGTSAAVEAAAMAQKLYLSVGKVLGVDEARGIMRDAGVDLDERTAADVFRDVPPMPAPSGAVPVLAATRSRRPAGVPQDQMVLAIEGEPVDA